MKIDKFVEDEIQKGKTHQEIFNEIVSASDFNIHDVANVVRKTPTLKKREKYKTPNLILAVILAIATASRLLAAYIVINQTNNDVAFSAMIAPLITGILTYGVYKYRRNAHLIAGVVMILNTLWAIIRLFLNFDGSEILNILFAISGSVLALYLNSKLVGDYALDKELQKTNPNQRENVLLFTE